MPGKKVIAMLDALGSQRSTEKSFASMLYFVKSQQSRIVQIRALKGGYPYYGEIETSPSTAGKSFKTGSRKALVDKTLMLQFNARKGDSIKVGKLNFEIEGAIDKVPGQTGITAHLVPAENRFLP